MGDPDRDGTASGDGKCTSPSPEEGRVNNILFPKYLDRKQLSLSLSPKRAWRVMDGSSPDHTHQGGHI